MKFDLFWVTPSYEQSGIAPDCSAITQGTVQGIFSPEDQTCSIVCKESDLPTVLLFLANKSDLF